MVVIWGIIWVIVNFSIKNKLNFLLRIFLFLWNIYIAIKLYIAIWNQKIWCLIVMGFLGWLIWEYLGNWGKIIIRIPVEHLAIWHRRSWWGNLILMGSTTLHWVLLLMNWCWGEGRMWVPTGKRSVSRCWPGRWVWRWINFLINGRLIRWIS